MSKRKNKRMANLNRLKENNIKQQSSISDLNIKKSIISSKESLSKETDLNDCEVFISSLAIEIWRLKKRIQKVVIEAGEKEESNMLQPISEQIERFDDILQKHNIEVIEHSGEKYNEGQSLKVLHIEEVDNLPVGEMKIIATIKPSVYLNGKIIFHGEVIVGKSIDKENNKGGDVICKEIQ